MKQSLRVLLSVALTTWLFAAAVSRADAAIYLPSPGNQYVTTTDTYLYVVWSVPKDLAPFAQLKSSQELETFVARTSLKLCELHAKRDASGKKDCKVQLLRLNSNDEYTKSAAGGFKTVATLVAPRAKLTPELFTKLATLDPATLRGLFSKFSIKHAELPLKAGA